MNCSFLADAMLGTLAKWLRILGYDTLFDPSLDDHQLVRLARAEDRILLTRDRELARRRGVHVLFIVSQELDEQVAQVLAEFEMEPNRAFSRCPVCNEPLRPLSREAARGRVPAYVAETHETFKHCPSCRRVYWRGSHRQQMEEYLSRLRSHPDRSGTGRRHDIGQHNGG